jgi:hypothetical protein
VYGMCGLSENLDVRPSLSGLETNETNETRLPVQNSKTRRKTRVGQLQIVK